MVIKYNFRSHIIWRATETFTSLSHSKFNGESKITNFNLHVISNKNITRFEISMHYSLVMHLLHGIYKLEQKVTGFHLTQHFTSLHQFM